MINSEPGDLPLLIAVSAWLAAVYGGVAVLLRRWGLSEPIRTALAAARLAGTAVAATGIAATGYVLLFIVAGEVPLTDAVRGIARFWLGDLNGVIMLTPLLVQLSNWRRTRGRANADSERARAARRGAGDHGGVVLSAGGRPAAVLLSVIRAGDLDRPALGPAGRRVLRAGHRARSDGRCARGHPHAAIHRSADAVADSRAHRVAAGSRGRGTRGHTAAGCAKESEQRALFAMSPDGVLSVDATGSIQLANAAATRLFGDSAEQKPAVNLGTLLPELRLRAVQGRATLKGKRGDGTEFPAEIAWAQVDSASTPRFLVTVRDATERLEAEQRLRERDAALARAMRFAVAGELASALAHELNQPITALVSYLRASEILAARDAVDEARLRDTLGKSMNEAIRASKCSAASAISTAPAPSSGSAST